MKRARKYQLFALTLLGATVVLVLATLPSTMLSTGIVGMAGEIDGDRFLIESVDRGSPAAVAGLRAGDRIAAIDGRPITRWYQLYRDHLSEYLAQRRGWHERPVTVSILGGDELQSIALAPRRMNLTELLAHFGAIVALIAILVSLTIFMLVSNPKDTTAHLATIGFCVFIASISAVKLGWPQFLSPLFHTYGSTEFLIHELIYTFGTQLVISILFHLILIFPRSFLSRRTLNALLPAIYLIPSGVIASILVLEPGSNLMDRMSAVYFARLWLNSALLILIPVVFIANYHGQSTRIQQEQARWIIRAVVTFAAIHVGLWNLPKLFIGEPLLPSYNWILLSFLLIPTALTASIANHHLFGIRGLIRRRMAYLDTMVQRQKSAVGRRDDRIKSLTDEIDQLRDELERYIASEDSGRTGLSATERLRRLEHDYPAIREARESFLLGHSPVWETVFEHAVLAAKGNVPVLITGESGTGKTQLAHTIGALSGCPPGPYREISCAQFEHADPAFALGKLFGVGSGHGLPNTLRSGQPGLLEECDGGALFLDDFDCLPPNAQDLLLYPLEGKPFEPGIGAGSPRRVSLKFILATNQDVDALVQRGKLRADVLARMGARVYIPPLRERVEDIPLLVEHLVSSLSGEFQHQIESISPKAMHVLRHGTYRKGNVRQLHAELRMAIGKASLENDPVLRAGYLPSGLHEEAGHARTSTARAPEPIADESTTAANRSQTESDTQQDTPQELIALRRNAFHVRKAEIELGLSHKSKTLSNHLRGRCIQALVDNDWDMEAAVRAIVGGDDAASAGKVRRKMLRYLASIRRGIAEGTENRLFNNLPTAYHRALSQAIRHVTEQG